MKKAIIPVALLATLTLTACGDNSSDKVEQSSKDIKEKSEVIVKTKLGQVTQSELLDDLGITKVGQLTFQSLMGDILREEYKDKLSLKDATKKVNEEIEKMGGEDALKMNLKNQGLGSIDNYKNSRIDSQYNQLLMNDVYKMSNEDVKKEVKKASHILIAVNDAANADQKIKNGLSESKAKEKATEILNRVKKDPSNFEAIAKEESSDTQSAQNGGSLDYVIKGQMVPEFEKELFKLKEGEISKLVKTQFGYHIIKADKQDDLKDRLQELKTTIIQQQSIKHPEKMKKAYRDLLKKYNVKYNDEDVKQMINTELLSDKVK